MPIRRPHRPFALALVAAWALPLVAQPAPRGRAPAAHVPGATWERRAPATLGVDSARLAEAIAFAVSRESRTPRDLEQAHYQTFGREPFGEAIGPFAARGPATGVIVRGGHVIASWGEPDRVDMTFSTTKSFVSAVVGLAHDRGLIPSVADTVAKAMAPIQLLRTSTQPDPASRYGQPSFVQPWETAHNRTITWDAMLRQTSDFEGTLWGKPDWADRPSGDASTWTTRPRAASGTTYEYNDVRVNALALAATNVWRRPLPEVLRDSLMDRIGASRRWRWTGYDNAWLVIDGRPVQVVSGGGHWGAGMFIDAWDMARFGLLTTRRGMWGQTRILSEAWVARSLTPTGPQPTYGYMNWFLNTDRTLWPSAPASVFGHLGNGTNIILCLPEQDIVAVVRWIERDAIDEFLRRLLAAVRS
jgi:CubicO group peptidase (beta-lactamase class C family)